MLEVTRNVALRKESVDRNRPVLVYLTFSFRSLSARRAWIEMHAPPQKHKTNAVALRKESVDRNQAADISASREARSLSARRAWIEIRHMLHDYRVAK